MTRHMILVSGWLACWNRLSLLCTWPNNDVLRSMGRLRFALSASFYFLNTCVAASSDPCLPGSHVFMWSPSSVNRADCVAKRIYVEGWSVTSAARS